MLGRKDFLSGGYVFNMRVAERLSGMGMDVDIIHFTTVPEGLPEKKFSASAHVCRRILKHDPDIIVIAKSYHYAGLLRLLKPLLGTPVLYLMHHLEWMDERNRIRSGMYITYVRWLLGMADAIWVNSLSTGTEIETTGIPGERIHRISPGFARSLNPPPDRSMREGPVRLLCVGSIAPRKAQEILLKACAMLEPGSFSLDLAGSFEEDDPYFVQMRDFIVENGLQDSIIFRGALPREELDRAYDSADILVHPARWEAFGISVLEGMWHGLPVVASDVAALPELVLPGENGLLVPTGDADAIAAALRTLIEDKNARLAMGIRSRSLADGRSDWNDTCNEFAELVLSTAGGIAR